MLSRESQCSGTNTEAVEDALSEVAKARRDDPKAHLIALIQEALKESTGIYRTIQMFRAEQKEPSKFLYFYFDRRCTGE